MKKIVKWIKEIKENHLQIMVISIFLLQIIFELDGVIYEFLDQFGLPRPSTLFHMIIIPLMVLIVFIRNENKKRRTTALFGAYFIFLAVYFVLHCINASVIRDELYLTGNFIYSHFQEFTYVFTLVIPYFIIYAFYRADFKEKTILNAILIASFTVSILILAGDIFLFGESTYNPFGTKASIFTWFSGIYDVYHPRDLASKFFFPEGNTLGIYQFIILPVLYYAFEKAKSRKEQLTVLAAIVLQSLAMVVLSTKVATYGTIIIPAASLVVWLLFVFLKQIRFKAGYFLFCLAMMGAFLMMLPYTPAYVNQQLDTENNFIVSQDKELLQMAINEGYHENNSIYDPALIYAFEVYAIDGNLMSATPEEYYLYYYDYRHDPQFWWNMLTVVPFEERTNGRQVQRIFNDYKWELTNGYSKLMGMGYSTFMNGSFLVEQDFVQQKYTLGYLGDLITLGPWIILAIAGMIKILFDFKNKFNYENAMFAMAFCAGIGASYVSGHTLDQYLTTTLLALIAAILIKNIFNRTKGEKNV